MNWSMVRSCIAALFLMGLQTIMVHAQTPAPQTPATSALDQSQQLLKPEQLDQLLAPIALYPDTLLAEILMASTYPLEVVQADRWATENKNLKGDQLKAAVDKQSWDDSVKALVATPSVLSMMSTKLDWTQKLGDAVLAQQPDVMDAVQRLRASAQANNKLASTKEQKVTTVQQQGRDVIVIEPAVPDTIYVPYYDPAVVYGTWPYASYPPYYFPPPYGYVPGALLATGLAFGAGYALGRWTSGGNYWGGGLNWGNRNINVNRPVNINTGNINVGNNWQHNSVHRQGVKYSNTNVQQKFGGNNNIRAGSSDRMDFRGRNGEQVLKPGGGAGNIGGGNIGDNRPGAGDRTPGNRPDAGNRPSQGGNRPDAGNRPSQGGNRPSAGNRPSGGGNRPAAGTPKRDSAMNVSSGRVANNQAARGKQSLASAGGPRGGGGGAPRASAGGGGPRGGGGGGARAAGGGGRGGGGGGRRSDINLKHDIVLLGVLDNGLGFYRYAYNGSDKTYVGVMAQEVQNVMPRAVVRGRDGYLRVFYEKLGLKFETYDRWIASGARIPSATGTGTGQAQIQ
jgi:Protein of unknown function (DUF3300)/Chaperone of endosialidase